jgi:hypothetical protein
MTPVLRIPGSEAPDVVTKMLPPDVGRNPVSETIVEMLDGGINVKLRSRTPVARPLYLSSRCAWMQVMSECAVATIISVLVPVNDSTKVA